MRKLNELKGLKLVLPIFIMAMLAADVAGVGIARSFNVVEFVPNEELSLQYFVYNDEYKDGAVTVNLEGSLRDSARLDRSFIEYKAKDELTPFTVTITLPEKPEGDLSVVVQEVSDEVGQLTATVRVVQRIQFAEKKEEPKVEVRQPVNITEIGSKFRQVILPDQIVEFSKTTAGRTMLYASLFATLVSVIVYLSTMMKRKPEEVVQEQTQQILVEDKTEEEQMNQELMTYLKAGLETGVMEELLISRLVAAGWAREVVDKHLALVKNSR